MNNGQTGAIKVSVTYFARFTRIGGDAGCGRWRRTMPTGSRKFLPSPASAGCQCATLSAV